MGLAASQARFLAVTSRKANCEYRTTELAQQKLSLTRELDDVSKEYQDALNSTMFVWDADGTGDFRYELSYDIMMRPSDYNQYTPYLLSRQDGKIALDAKIMNAVGKIFNIDENTGTTDGGITIGNNTYYKGDAGYVEAQEKAFAMFINELKNEKAIQPSVAAKMKGKDNTYTYIKDAGVGGEMYAKEKYNMMNANGLCSYIDYMVDNSVSGYFAYDSKEFEQADKLVFDFERKKYLLSTSEKDKRGYTQGVGEVIYDLENAIGHHWSSTNGNTCILINGTYANDSMYKLGTQENKTGGYNNVNYSASAFTLADLLNEDVSLLVTGQQDYGQLLPLLKVMANDVVNSSNGGYLINNGVDQWYDKYIAQSLNNTGTSIKYRDYNQLVKYAKLSYNNPNDVYKSASSTLALLNFFDGLAKSMWELLMPKDPTKEELNAYYLALENTIVRLQNKTSSSSARNYDSDYVDCSTSGWDTETQAKNAVNQAENYNCWVKSGNEWAISLSNLTESFLTDFVNGMDNFQDNCIIGKKATSSTYITDYPNYQYTVNVVNESDTGLWESEFYSAIFNNICNCGAYKNENLSDNKYLENALKNGQLFVMSKANDNRYYQSKYTDVSGGHFIVEKDSAAIERAEREYLYKKNQINYKEEKIEIEMKQLDAEINELSTELESVKALIKTGIDKTLKMFQS